MSTSAVSSTLSPTEESHFDHLHFAGIDSRECVERVIDGDQVGSPDRCLLRRCLRKSVAATSPPRFPGYDAARGQPEYASSTEMKPHEEMGAILPLHPLVVDESHVGFIYRGRLSAGCDRGARLACSAVRGV